MYTDPLAFPAGSPNTGLSANITAFVYDNAGTLQATINTGWGEKTAGSGNYASWAFTRNPAWGVIKVDYVLTSAVGGTFYATETRNIDPVAAGIEPNVLANGNGGLGLVDSNGLMAAKLDPKNIAGTAYVTVSASPSPTQTTFAGVLTGGAGIIEGESYLRWQTGSANAGGYTKITGFLAGAYTTESMPNAPVAGDVAIIGGHQ